MNNPKILSINKSDVPVLALQGVVRTFHQGREALQVLRGADLEISAGEIV
jgi:hypothetical protein